MNCPPCPVVEQAPGGAQGLGHGEASGLVAGGQIMVRRPWVDHSTPDADVTRISCKVIKTAVADDRLELHFQMHPSNPPVA
jgi:hypothetical protein